MVTTTVPSTLAEELAPKVSLAIVVTVTSSTTSTTESSTSVVQQSYEAKKLIKAMEYMSIQNNEINRLKEKIKNLEDAKKLAQINAETEGQKAKSSSEKLKKGIKRVNPKRGHGLHKKSAMVQDH